MRFKTRTQFLTVVVLPMTVAILADVHWNLGAHTAVAQQKEEPTTRLGTKTSDRTKPDFDIVQNLNATGEFKTLLKLLKAADLVSELKGPGDRTLFAPSDSAFEKLPKGTIERLLRIEGRPELVRLLKNHVANSMKVTAEDLGKGIGPTVQMTMGKDSIVLDKRRNQFTADRVNIVRTDIYCKNGVIHVIDGLLTP